MPIRLALTLLACLGIIFSPQQTEAQTPARFHYVYQENTHGYQVYRIPALVETTQGNLLAFAEARKLRSNGDSGDIDLVVKSSADQGRTWSEMRIVWDDGANTCGNPVPIVDRETGRIHLLMTWNHGSDRWGDLVNQRGEDTRRVFHTWSDDEGETWRAPIEITKQVKDPSWDWYGTGPVHGIQIQEGPHKGRLVVPSYYSVREEGRTKLYSHVFYSDNGGRSWTRGSSTPEGDVGECSVAEIGGGALMLNMRASDGDFRKFAISHDGGATWGEVQTDGTQLDPGCQGSLLYAPDSQLLFLANPASVERENMMIKASANQGRDWNREVRIHAGPSAYSDLAMVGADKIAILYEGGVGRPYEGIAFEAVDLERLVSNAPDGELEVFTDDPRFEVRPLFAEERFPNIVVTTEGTILAVWGRDQVRVRRSEDGGETWGPEIPVGAGIHGGGATIDERTGDILVFVEDEHPSAPLTVYRSSDDGKTWAESPAVVHPDENGRLTSMHMNERGTTLRHGQHAGRLIRPSRVYAEGNDEAYRHIHYTNAVYSDDGGNNWHASAPFPAYGTGEAALVELSDGTIYYNSRRHVSTDGLDPRWRHIAWSDDGGETWRDLSVSEVLPDGPQNLDYGLMAGLVRLPVEGADILLFSNVDSPGRPDGDERRWSERRRGTIWASFDGGRTWPLKRLVTDGPYAYSSLTAGRPGTVSEGWIYLLFEGSSQGPHVGGQVARFNLSWVLAGEETGDGELPEDFAEMRDRLLAEAPERSASVLVLPRELTNPDVGALFETDLFWQGYNGYHTFRIPSLIEAPDGTLLAFAEGRRNSQSDAGDIDTVLRRSFDGGKTWGPMQIVWDDGENTCGNPTALVDRTRDRVWLFMTHNLGHDTQSRIGNGTSEGVRTIWSVYSDDNGATWSQPVNRFHQVQAPDTRWDATGPGNGIQLVHGPNAGRLIVPANGRNIQSDDFGRTWYEGGKVPNGTSEATVVELSDGTLMRNSRATGSLRDHRRRVVNYSSNGGASWTPVQVREDLPCPICQGSMIAHAHPEGEKPWVLFSNPGKYAPDDSTSHDRRLRMTVRRSASDGDVFEHSKMIFPRDAAYSSLASRQDGSVALLYENGDDWPYRRITFAAFSTDWIADPGVLRMDFEDFEPGQNLPTAANAIADRTSYGLAGTATAPLRVVEGREAGEAAVRFTGNGSSIHFSDTENRGRLNFDADDSFIIRVVFKTGSHKSGGASGSGALIAKDVGASSPSWWLRVEDGRARFFVDDGNTAASVRSDAVVADGAWHDLKVIRDATARRFYLVLDGQIVGQAGDGTAGDFANTNDVVIGGFNNGSRAFAGEIAKIEIVRGPVDVLTGYEAWKQVHFNDGQRRNAAISGPFAIPAGDGVTNLVKYALDLPPFAALSRKHFPQVEAVPHGLLMVYRERTDVSDVAYVAEVSDDLITWNGDTDRIEEIFRGSREGNLEEVALRATFPEEIGRGFMRLRIARHP